MKKNVALFVILAITALLILGCSRGGGNYQTGYAAYNQPAYQGGAGQGGYVGGGCAVSGPEQTDIIDAEGLEALSL
jgi:hypothetical protein